MKITEEQIEKYSIPSVEVGGWDDQELLDQAIEFLNPLLKEYGVELHIVWSEVRQVHTIAVLPLYSIVK